MPTATATMAAVRRNCPGCHYLKNGRCVGEVTERDIRHGKCPFRSVEHGDGKDSWGTTSLEAHQAEAEAVREEQPYAGERDEARDKEMALAAEQLKEDRKKAAKMLADVIRGFLAASGGNAQTLLAMMHSMGGMTYSEVGSLMGISKQAVCKHMAMVARRNPVLAEVLSRRRQLCESLTLKEREATEGSTEYSRNTRAYGKRLVKLAAKKRQEA